MAEVSARTSAGQVRSPKGKPILPLMDDSLAQTAAVQALKGASDEQLIAALELMYLVAKADGFVAADELRQFLAVTRAVGNTSVDSQRLSELLGGWRQNKPLEIEARATALAEVLGTEKLRRAAYELASLSATADKTLEKDELDAIVRIGDILGVT